MLASWPELPAPDVPPVALPGLAFSQTIRSCTVLAGKSLRATSSVGDMDRSATGSRYILDNRRLAERLAQAFRKNAGNHVGRSPRRERHNECDRPVGIALCPNDALKGQLCDRERGQVQESATVKHTGACSPSICSVSRRGAASLIHFA